MKSIRRMMGQVRAMLRVERADAEMERELAAHLLLLEDEMMRKGATPDEARRLARIKLGGVEQVRIMHREERGIPFDGGERHAGTDGSRTWGCICVVGCADGSSPD